MRKAAQDRTFYAGRVRLTLREQTLLRESLQLTTDERKAAWDTVAGTERDDPSAQQPVVSRNVLRRLVTAGFREEDASRALAATQDNGATTLEMVYAMCLDWLLIHADQDNLPPSLQDSEFIKQQKQVLADAERRKAEGVLWAQLRDHPLERDLLSLYHLGLDLKTVMDNATALRDVLAETPGPLGVLALKVCLLRAYFPLSQPNPHVIPLDAWKIDVEDELVALRSILGDACVTSDFTSCPPDAWYTVSLSVNDLELRLALVYSLNYPTTSGPLLEAYGHPQLTIAQHDERQELLRAMGQECNTSLGCPSCLLLIDGLARHREQHAASSMRTNGRRHNVPNTLMGSPYEARTHALLEHEREEEVKAAEKKTRRIEPQPPPALEPHHEPQASTSTQGTDTRVASPRPGGREGKNAVARQEEEAVLQDDDEDPSPRMRGETPCASPLTLDEERQRDIAAFDATIRKTQRKSRDLLKMYGQKKDPKLEEARHKLPAMAKRNEILELIDKHQVVVISGETGCGKTTQVPQFILEDWIQRGRGAAVSIVMTQPRRLPTLAVADRIAREVGTDVGRLVGYQIQLERRLSAATRLTVCTTGILLQRLREPTLKGTTHVIVDEVHERDMDTDFLLILLRAPTLRLILMSATIRSEIFASYFGGAPLLTIPGRTYPVKRFFLEDCLYQCKYLPEPTSAYCRKAAPMTMHPTELKKFRDHFAQKNRDLSDPQVLTNDVVLALNRMELRCINYDLITEIVRYINRGECSAFLSGNEKEETSDNPGAILIFLPGFSEISRCVEALQSSESAGGLHSSERFLNYWLLPLHSLLSVEDQSKVFRRSPPGYRKIVIATNIAETSITIDDIRYVIDSGRHVINLFDYTTRTTTLKETWCSQANTKQRMGRAGRVAKGFYFALFTSQRWGHLDPATRPEMCRASLDQLCLTIHQLRLGTPLVVLQQALDPPSAQHVDAAIRHLQDMNALSDGSIASPYAVKMIQTAGRQTHKQLHGQQNMARTDMCEQLQLTPMGEQLARLPTDVVIGKLLLMGCVFGVVEEVLTMASILTVREPFRITLSSREDTDRVKQQLGGSSESDHLVSLRVMEMWDQLRRQQREETNNVPNAFARHHREQRKFCDQYCLDYNTVTKIETLRENFREVLQENGLSDIHETASTLVKANVPLSKEDRATEFPALTNEALWDGLERSANCRDGTRARDELHRRRRALLRAVLCSALWPQVVTKEPASRQQELERATFFSPLSGLETAGAYAHPSSVCSRITHRDARHPLYVYQTKTVSDRGGRQTLYLQQMTGVSLRAAVLLGGKITTEGEVASGRLLIDHWISIELCPADTAFVRAARHRFEQILWKLTNDGGASSPSSPNTKTAISADDKRFIFALTHLLLSPQ